MITKVMLKLFEPKKQFNNIFNTFLYFWKPFRECLPIGFLRIAINFATAASRVEDVCLQKCFLVSRNKTKS